MKRILGVFAATVLVVMLAHLSYAAVNGGSITTTVNSSSQITVVVDTLASDLDSLYVAAFIAGSTDTTFIALLDSAATDTTLTGLAAATQHILFLLARDTDSKTAISDKDTVYTYTPMVGDYDRDGYLYRDILTDDSWLLNDDYRIEDGVFDLSGIGASDYSLLYYSKPYNGLDVIATQAADSTVATIYFYPVDTPITPTATATWYRGSTVADSVNVTAAGLTRDSVSLPVGRLYQMYIETLTGNGKDADYILRFTSDPGE
jgi:hypothetical protein